MFCAGNRIRDLQNTNQGTQLWNVNSETAGLCYRGLFHVLYPSVFLPVSRIIKKTTGRVSRPDWNSNPVPPERESRVLTLRRSYHDLNQTSLSGGSLLFLETAKVTRAIIRRPCADVTRCPHGRLLYVCVLFISCHSSKHNIRE
jgi:hypothetical protein